MQAHLIILLCFKTNGIDRIIYFLHIPNSTQQNIMLKVLFKNKGERKEERRKFFQVVALSQSVEKALGLSNKNN